jgi:rubrerythrin
MGRLIDADRLKAHYCWWAGGSKEMSIDEAKKTFDTIIDVQPTVDANPVQPIEFEWCHDCKEYDQDAHCCHRWTKVIRNTVNDLKTQGYELVRYGHWEIDKRGNWVCSLCGNGPYHDNMKNMDYCPNCGAKMEKREKWLLSYGRKERR